MTAGAALAGAGVGGIWAYFRYRQQAPDMPRVNAVVTATLITTGGLDYLSIGVDLRHLAGGKLAIDPEGNPRVHIYRLTASETPGAAVTATEIGDGTPVLVDQREVGSSEFVTDNKLVLLGRRQRDTIAYDATLKLSARWRKHDAWDWSTNAIVRVDGPASASGAGVLGGHLPTRGRSRL